MPDPLRSLSLLVLLVVLALMPGGSALAQTTPCPDTCEAFANPPPGTFVEITAVTAAVYADDAFDVANRFDSPTGLLAGCVDGEQRGIAAPQIIDGAAFYFLSVQGAVSDIEEPITFRFCLGEPGAPVAVAVPNANTDNTPTFAPSRTYGSASIPYRLEVPTAVLPVELAAFEGVVEGAVVHLRWSTRSETNNAGFGVEHRAGGAWREVAWVAGHGTTTEARRYVHRVTGLAPGHHAFRLRQVDYDGTATHGPVVEVAVLPAAGVHLSAPYPHPLRRQARFTLATARTEHVRLDLFDALGRRVATLHDGPLPAGEAHPFTLRGDRLPAGAYILRATGETFTATRRLVRVP